MVKRQKIAAPMRRRRVERVGPVRRCGRRWRHRSAVGRCHGICVRAFSAGAAFTTIGRHPTPALPSTPPLPFSLPFPLSFLFFLFFLYFLFFFLFVPVFSSSFYPPASHLLRPPTTYTRGLIDFGQSNLSFRFGFAVFFFWFVLILVLVWI